MALGETGMTRTTKPLPANNQGLDCLGLDVLRNPLGWFAALVLLFASAGTYAQDAPGNTLQDIQVQSLPGQQVELRLILSGPAPEPLSFTIDNPARIALDLPDTALGLSSRRRDVDLRMLDTVLTAEANGRTRVVLNLDSMVPYETRVSGNTVILTLGEGGDRVAETTTFTGAPSASAAAASGPRAIENVDFRRKAAAASSST